MKYLLEYYYIIQLKNKKYIEFEIIYISPFESFTIFLPYFPEFTEYFSLIIIFFSKYVTLVYIICNIIKKTTKK